MARHLHLAPHLGDLAVLVDQKGGAIDTHVFAAVQALLDPGAIFGADLSVLVGNQREVKLVLRLELVVTRYAVLADADNLRLEFLEGSRRIAKAAGFGRASRRVVLGIEIEDDWFAAELGKRELAATVGRCGEVRGFLAFIHAHCSLLPFHPATRAGPSTRRSYIARASATSLSIRRRKSAMLAAPSVVAISRRWPSGALRSSKVASSPSSVSRSRLCTSDSS